MDSMNRRNWLQKSLLTSTTLLTGGAVVRPFHQYHKPINLTEEFLPLHWNENPYGPSKLAIEAVKNIAKSGHRYPDDTVQDLKEKIAQNHDLLDENVMITAGSTELLSLLGQHAGLKGGEIITPWASFPTLIRFGQRTGATISKVPLSPNNTLDLDSVLNSISDKTSLVFICNPNNPTSTEVENEMLRNFCKKVPKHVLIVVDEAYIEFSKLGGQGSMVSLVSELSNLIVCRTFSKAYGLAGFRIGYGISQSDNIRALRNRHLGFELSAGIAPLAAAISAMGDQEHLDLVINKNQLGREIVYSAFDKWGVAYNDSSTNFLYAKSNRFEADLVSKLKTDKILITKWPGIMKDHVRISISKPEHMERFVSSASKYLL